MTAVVPVGVVGLGRRWRRLLPNLYLLRRRLAVRAVCDSVAGRAEREARRLGCAAAVGPVELLEREDVQALLLLDRQWYGLWPIERACAVAKPVFCAFALTPDEQTRPVRARVEEASLSVLMAPRRWGRLLQPRRRWLPDTLGPPRLVRAEGVVRGEARLDSPVLLPLLDASAAWHGCAPQAVWADEGTDGALVVLEFSEGRRAQVTLTVDPLKESWARLWVATEKGTVELSSPRRLCWRDPSGRHERRLSDPGSLVPLLARFARAVREGGPFRPTFTDACTILNWQRAALQSRSEGRWVSFAEDGSQRF